MHTTPQSTLPLELLLITSKKYVTIIAMKLRSKAKAGSYEDIHEGDPVRIPIMHKTPKGF